jgi:hypothetical protein
MGDKSGIGQVPVESWVGIRYLLTVCYYCVFVFSDSLQSRI